MKTSARGLRDLMIEEGFKNAAYPDPAHGWAVPTIGVGHTGPEVYPGLWWDNATVMEALRKDVKDREDSINRSVRVKLNQDQYDALVDFVFNIGVPAFERSTLLRLLNAGKYEATGNEFLAWCIPDMLIPRRQRTRAKFLGRAVEAHKTTVSLADVQRRLGVTADGILGPKTKAAIEAYQKAHGLIVDGLVGPRTLASMGLA